MGRAQTIRRGPSENKPISGAADAAARHRSTAAPRYSDSQRDSRCRMGRGQQSLENRECRPAEGSLGSRGDRNTGLAAERAERPSERWWWGARRSARRRARRASRSGDRRARGSPGTRRASAMSSSAVRGQEEVDGAVLQRAGRRGGAAVLGGAAGAASSSPTPPCRLARIASRARAGSPPAAGCARAAAAT